MDTSPEYIKMCDCPEIQSKWEIGVDAMMHPATDPHDYTQMILKPRPKYKTQQACITIWLPRQDQIQAMFEIAPYILFSQFNKEMENYVTGDPDSWSFEMLWLAFYMLENHQKIWDGEKWVKSAKE